jgi:hypothetical protein
VGDLVARLGHGCARQTVWRMVPEREEMTQPLHLSQIVQAVVDGMLNADDYCVYTREDGPTAISDPICYLDEFPDVDEHYQEVYSPFVVEHQLKLFYHGNLLVDVVTNAKGQKAEPTMDELLRGLDYYLERDTFLDL